MKSARIFTSEEVYVENLGITPAARPGCFRVFLRGRLFRRKTEVNVGASGPLQVGPQAARAVG